ncbi:hypothetical protein [Fodinibius saliphilus]|nr:hypothetical protein [Fodinibius saliphilus]
MSTKTIYYTKPGRLYPDSYSPLRKADQETFRRLVQKLYVKMTAEKHS